MTKEVTAYSELSLDVAGAKCPENKTKLEREFTFEGKGGGNGGRENGREKENERRRERKRGGRGVSGGRRGRERDGGGK